MGSGGCAADYRHWALEGCVLILIVDLMAAATFPRITSYYDRAITTTSIEKCR